MKSLILSVATRLLLPLLLLFSFFLLLRGHNEPGGGFVGGLVASAAFALYTISAGVEQARNAIRYETVTFIGVGLFIAVISAILPLFLDQPFFTILWYPYEVPVLGKVGTALTFDLGVYLVVIGATLTIVFAMAETEED